MRSSNLAFSSKRFPERSIKQRPEEYCAELHQGASSNIFICSGCVDKLLQKFARFNALLNGFLQKQTVRVGEIHFMLSGLSSLMHSITICLKGLKGLKAFSVWKQNPGKAKTPSLCRPFSIRDSHLHIGGRRTLL